MDDRYSDLSFGRYGHKRPLKKFKKEPKYAHHRSEGLTRRRNKGSALQLP